MRLKSFLIPAALAASFFSVAQAQSERPPPVLDVVMKEGWVLERKLETISGLTGWLFTMPNGEQKILYTTEDREIFIYGALVDSTGKKVTVEQLQKYRQP